MNKKFVASLSAMFIVSSFFTVSAAPNAAVKKIVASKIVQSKKTQTQKSDAIKAIEDQLNANSQAAEDLINKVLQSNEYKQLQIKNLELQKSIIDQKLKEGNISTNQATSKKAQLDAQIKMIQDTTLQTIKADVASLEKQIKALLVKYPKLTDLIVTQDFKDVKAKLITDLKAIIDRYVADGAITSDEATTAKSAIDTASSSIDAGKASINSLFRIFSGSKSGKGRNQNFKNNVPSNNTKGTVKTTLPGSSI